jgi:hypothetical protein
LLPEDYVLLGIDTGNADIEQGPGLNETTSCRAFGDRWLNEGRSALLEVPSVIVPESHNVLINPLHPDAGTIGIITTRPWNFDPRLFEQILLADTSSRWCSPSGRRQPCSRREDRHVGWRLLLHASSRSAHLAAEPNPPAGT